MTQPNSSPKSILRSQGWEGGIHRHCPRTLGALGKPHFPHRAGTMTIHVYKGAEQGRREPSTQGPTPGKEQTWCPAEGIWLWIPCLWRLSCVADGHNQGETSWKGTGSGGASPGRGWVSCHKRCRRCTPSSHHLHPSSLHTSFLEGQSTHTWKPLCLHGECRPLPHSSWVSGPVDRQCPLHSCLEGVRQLEGAAAQWDEMQEKSRGHTKSSGSEMSGQGAMVLTGGPDRT